ncbi:TonB-dependent siderophore receptor [Paracoccus sp. J56]|uniref:TonB-dependent siderophore receptor n=1 Tax=Paracoccus sp. J56 TaxID=935850 RepID=UPI000A0E4EB0|nr:TonB-dependent siderophore receptor [Paracoccus sp. J56]SMG55625.1 outer-membrane receptor for ferric coprogen and ferric-rhodotorulic acid [Paracoccus sp. J56]
MTRILLIPSAASVRLTTALGAGILTMLACPALAQEAEDGAESTVVLDEVTITAAPGTETEGSGSWTTAWMRSATGLVLSQKETPQSTSAVTHAQMQDRNITTIAQTMEAATGITVQAYESDRINYYARGFYIDAYQYDGVPTPRNGAWTFGDNNPDMALYDHVEIVRGATGLMQGAGEPGASVNFIRKRPTSEFQNQTAVSLAYPKGGRVEADVSGPLNTAGTVRGRFVAVADSRDGSLDAYHKDKYVLYGAIEADLGDNTVLNAGISYQKTRADNVTWGGLPPYYADGGLIDWNKGATLGADWTYVDTERTEAFASLEHVFDNGWTARLVATHIRSEADMELAWISGSPDRETGLGMTPSAVKYNGTTKVSSLNGMLNGDFQAFGRDHQFVLGATVSDFKSDYSGYAADRSSLTPVGNIFDWDGSYPRPRFSDAATTIWHDKQRQYGLYATTRLQASDALSIIAGARANWWKGSEATTGELTYEYSYNGEITPYLGFTYDLNPTYTAYGSVTSIYKPQIVLDKNGDYLDPTYGWNYELGVKADLMGGAMYASAAIFQTNQKDVANWVGNDETDLHAIYESIDGTRTRGFEVELAGAISDRWNISGGYTFRTSEDKDGKRFAADQPKHTLKIATDYRLAGILDEKLTLGGAMRWQSGTDSMNFASDSQQTNVHQGSYAVFDLNARYELTDKTELSLSVNNVFDKEYYATTGFYGRVVYGEPRSAELTLRAKF